MCGRYSLAPQAGILRAHFKLDATPIVRPCYNISPSQDCPVIVKQRSTARKLTFMRWGLIPSWSSGPTNKFSMFNARSETVSEKPAFREALTRRRCLIPTDGYYEWTSQKTNKQAYRITMQNQTIFAFAGLWESWQRNGKKINSFTILTAQSSPAVSQIHHRMPLIVAPHHYTDWLANTCPVKTLITKNDLDLVGFKVSNKINNPRYNEPESIIPECLKSANRSSN